MGVRNGGRSLLDTMLDRAVVPGYTRVGYRLRQPGWAVMTRRYPGASLFEPSLSDSSPRRQGQDDLVNTTPDNIAGEEVRQKMQPVLDARPDLVASAQAYRKNFEKRR